MAILDAALKAIIQGRSRFKPDTRIPVSIEPISAFGHEVEDILTRLDAGASRRDADGRVETSLSIEELDQLSTEDGIASVTMRRVHSMY